MESCAVTGKASKMNSDLFNLWCTIMGSTCIIELVLMIALALKCWEEEIKRTRELMERIQERLSLLKARPRGGD